MSESERDRFRGRYIGFVFQQFHLMPAISVAQNLLLAQRLSRSCGPPPPVSGLLESLGLESLADRKPRELSHGQAQRVAIARAVCHRPELVIADEPTSALDDRHASDALTLLRQATEQQGAALLVVTHDQRIRGQISAEFALTAAHDLGEVGIGQRFYGTGDRRSERVTHDTRHRQHCVANPCRRSLHKHPEPGRAGH